MVVANQHFVVTNKSTDEQVVASKLHLYNFPEVHIKKKSSFI